MKTFIVGERAVVINLSDGSIVAKGRIAGVIRSNDEVKLVRVIGVMVAPGFDNKEARLTVPPEIVEVET